MTIKFSGRPLIIAATTSTLVLGMSGYIYKEEHRPKVLEVYVFALKSGRSMFIRTPDDKRYLIDGGANSDIVRQISSILPFYTKRIDGMVATNSDGKNITGLIDVMNRYKVDRVYVPKFTIESLGLASSTDQIYSTFLETIDSKNITKQEIMADDFIHIDPGTALSTGKITHPVGLQIIFPLPLDQFSYSKASAPEVLFRISYGENSVVFLGSASNKVQKSLVHSTSNIAKSESKSDVNGASFKSFETNLSSPDQSWTSFPANALDNTDVLVVSHSALSANMSHELMSQLRPQSLVYSKMVTNTSSKPKPKTKSINKTSVTSSTVNSSAASSKGTTKKKQVPDPFVAILDDQRFNLKEVGTVKIVVDGEKVQISPI